jgi:hypothetical protein
MHIIARDRTLSNMIRIEIDKCWRCRKKVKEGERIICPDGLSKNKHQQILPPERLVVPEEWITTRRLEKISTWEWRSQLSKEKGFQPEVLYAVVALCKECYQEFGECERCGDEFTVLYFLERRSDGRFCKKKLCEICYDEMGVRQW